MMDGRRPTMQDIANHAGVGKATVSLALRNDPRLKPQTRQRIQRIATELGYHVNATVANLMAQLRSSQTPKYQATLGLVNAAPAAETLSGLRTFRDWVSGCGRRAEQLGYQMDEIWLREPGLGPERLINILDSRGIRGLIIGGVLDQGILPEDFSAIWRRFASVVLGVRPRQPALHFACNDQFSTALVCMEELLRRGYKRPGLVVAPEVDENVEFRFSAGFWVGQQRLAAAARLPVFDFSPDAGKAFRAWFQKHKPDAVICVHEQVKSWMEGMGVKIPEEVALAHLDRTADLEEWAGMRQNNEVVGMAAVDMLVGQIHRNEGGEPQFPKCMLIEGSWVEGRTVGKGARLARA